MTEPRDQPPFVAASDRNKQPIFERLAERFPARLSVLEIGSGWGQHAVHFCRNMPGWDWQPSDRADRLPELRRELAAAGVAGIRSPLALDVLHDVWPSGPYDAAYSANTAHIMPWETVCAMFEGVSGCLAPGGVFCLYGPFNVEGAYTSEGNEDFDRRLRAQEQGRGLRDIVDLESLARSHQMEPEERIPMPANNFLLVFRKNEYPEPTRCEK